MIFWHKNLVYTLAEVLLYIFNENQYADKVLENIFKQNKRWGARDRAFIAENLYDMVRYKRRIMNSIGLIGLNQENIFHFIGCHFILKKECLPDWDVFKGLNTGIILKKYQLIQGDFAVYESIPDWLNRKAISQLGMPFWQKEMTALNKMASVVLRVNTLKTNRETLQEKLNEKGIKTHVLTAYPNALILDVPKNVFATDLFKKGWFEVQDAASQSVVPYLDLKPGLRVIDACAGAGGKTLHMAMCMQNKGQIIALDIHQKKLERLKQRAKRNGVQNIQTRVIDGPKVIKRLANSADALLIDAPCSGLGVLRRNPDAKWKLQPEFIEEIKEKQRFILQQYASMLRLGGHLVYATCSILPEENEDQVAYFLEQNPNFEKVVERKFFAHIDGFDGFYIAKMKKISG